MKGRREPRIAKVLRMKVRGVGRNGNSCVQETRTTDYQPERGTAGFYGLCEGSGRENGLVCWNKFARHQSGSY